MIPFFIGLGAELISRQSPAKALKPVSSLGEDSAYCLAGTLRLLNTQLSLTIMLILWKKICTGNLNRRTLIFEMGFDDLGFV